MDWFLSLQSYPLHRRLLAHFIWTYFAIKTGNYSGIYIYNIYIYPLWHIATSKQRIYICTVCGWCTCHRCVVVPPPPAFLTLLTLNCAWYYLTFQPTHSTAQHSSSKAARQHPMVDPLLYLSPLLGTAVSIFFFFLFFFFLTFFR